MRIVKLNNTHRLYREGYQYAFRFDSIISPNAWKVKELFIKNFKFIVEYNTFRAKKSSTYWIGFRDESIGTMVLLMI